MSFDKKLKRIDYRIWDKISAKWLANNLPNIQNPGQAPEFEISDFPGLDTVVNMVPDTGEHKDDLIGLRNAIFHEGIYLFYKSLNVSGATEIHIDNGILSWSLSSGYHSAFFAAKSIMCFLGVTFTSVDNEMVMIDVWPEPEKISKTKISNGVIPEQKMKFVKMPRLDHHKIWMAFQRILRTLTIDIWEENYLYFLKNIDPKHFAKQRNYMHYRNNHWQFKDLHEQLYLSDFSLKYNLVEDIVSFDQDSDDFSIILSYVLLYLSFLLLKDITDQAPLIQDEFNLINTSLTESWHSKFREIAQLN